MCECWEMALIPIRILTRASQKSSWTERNKIKKEIWTLPKTKYQKYWNTLSEMVAQRVVFLCICICQASVVFYTPCMFMPRDIIYSAFQPRTTISLHPASQKLQPLNILSTILQCWIDVGTGRETTKEANVDQSNAFGFSLQGSPQRIIYASISPCPLPTFLLHQLITCPRSLYIHKSSLYCLVVPTSTSFY